MTAHIGQMYEQIKALDGFPYNAVGEAWAVNNIQGKYVVLKNGGVGLGVDKKELEEHFKLLPQSQSSQYDDYDEDDEEEYDYLEDDSNNQQVSKFDSFLQ